MKPDYTFEEYMDYFNSFLEKRNLRKTYERNVILRTVYNFEEHFTLETLLQKLQKTKEHICATTLYTTLNLFVEAGLVIKHHFPSQPPQYEKSCNIRSHNHLYMEDTNEIIEFSDNKLLEIIKNTEDKYKVKATRYSLTIYCRNRE
jgi:Fur family ferric uptake transcriptional regulator